MEADFCKSALSCIFSFPHVNITLLVHGITVFMADHIPYLPTKQCTQTYYPRGKSMEVTKISYVCRNIVKADGHCRSSSEWGEKDKGFLSYLPFCCGERAGGVRERKAMAMLLVLLLRWGKKQER